MIEAHWVKREDWKAKVGAFVSMRIWGEVRDWGPYAAMAVIQDGKLIGGVIANHYHSDEGVIEVSGASDSKLWLTRPVLNTLFNRIFGELECQNLIMRISVDDLVMQRILKSFGYEIFRLPRLRGRHEDELVCMLFDDVWRTHPMNSLMVTGREPTATVREKFKRKSRDVGSVPKHQPISSAV